MTRSVLPSRISGCVSAPASKSMMQRLLAAALLAPGQSEIRHSGYCDDTRSAMAAARCLGATLQAEESRVKVTGGLQPAASTIPCGESGLALRLFTAVAALANREIELSGRGSLLRRPVGLIEEPLASLGARAATRGGFPPVRVCGPLTGGEARLDASLGSQFLTGLLMALPLAGSDSRIAVCNLQSAPYVALTLQVLREFGVRVENDSPHTYFVPGRQRYTPRSLAVEGDWSGAAFLLVAAAVAGEATVTGLRPDSLQADRMILPLLEQSGAGVSWQDGGVRVTQCRLRAFDADATHAPDLFPPLVALACHCAGKSRIRGVGRLRFKESNRALALLEEFRGLGARIAVAGDRMEIEGAPLAGGKAHAHHDHRIAMAVAVAALAGRGEVVIAGSECVGKSYPQFFADLGKLGGKTHE